MTPEERAAAFARIKAWYAARDDERLARGELSMGHTAFGFWGTTNMDDAFALFRRVRLWERRRFLDLGSGDGRVAAIASLFTRAAGIEGDADLHAQATEARDALGLGLDLINGDFRTRPLTAYDALYMFPDKRFDRALLDKLRRECRGILYVYTATYPPRSLPNGTTIWIAQLPVLSYPLEGRAS